MTCIVGVKTERGVIVGGDSAATAGHQINIRLDPKVFLLGPLAVGFTHSFRFGQLIRYGLSVPDYPIAGVPDFEWMVRRFIPSLSDALATWKRTENGRDEGGAAVVGIAGSLFCVASDFQVEEWASPYVAVGCGDELALGAMHAASAAGVTGRDLAHAGLAAAAEFSSGVAPPFNLVSTDAPVR